jgi:hypothetical protein
MSTRRHGELRFDHGAQYFTVRDRRFEQSVRAWSDRGLVRPWDGRIVVLDEGSIQRVSDSTERWVGVPGMNAVCRHLADGLDIDFDTRIVHAERNGGRWHLETDTGSVFGPFDALVVTAPAPQTAELLLAAAPEMAARIEAVEMAPCWAVMAAFAGPLALDLDGAFVHGSPLSWVARNASKPGRPDRETWVLHGSPEWSKTHLELDSEVAAHRLLDTFSEALGRELPPADHLVAHRWRFALPIEPIAEACLFDDDLAVVACGDWVGGPRVEGAFLSGSDAAGRLVSLQPSPSQTADPRHAP